MCDVQSKQTVDVAQCDALDAAVGECCLMYKPKE